MCSSSGKPRARKEARAVRPAAEVLVGRTDDPRHRPERLVRRAFASYARSEASGRDRNGVERPAQSSCPSSLRGHPDSHRYVLDTRPSRTSDARERSEAVGDRFPGSATTNRGEIERKGGHRRIDVEVLGLPHQRRTRLSGSPVPRLRLDRGCRRTRNCDRQERQYRERSLHWSQPFASGRSFMTARH
jgi:hypothetical protein